MNDLNLVTFFKASFSIRAHQENTDILWELVCVIRTWLMDKYNKDDQEIILFKPFLWTKLKNGGILYSVDEDKIVYCQSIFFASERTSSSYWACRVTESPAPERDYAQRQWITEVVYRERSNEGHLDLVIKYRDRAGYIGHYTKQPVITVPRIIKLILEHRKLFCHSAGIQLHAHPIELKTGDGMKLRDLIFNPVRDLPLIYISPKASENKWTDVGVLFASPVDVNRCVMGNAFVFYSQSLSFSEEADYLLGKHFKCNSGDIRVYFPKFDPTEQAEEARRHRLIFAETVEQWGMKEVLTIFRKAFAQNSDFFKHVLDYDTCSFMRNREFHQSQMDEKEDTIKQLDERISKIQNITQEEKDQLFALAQNEANKYDKISDEYTEMIGEYDKLEKERDDLKQRLFNQSLKLEELNKKHVGGFTDENSLRLISRLAKMPSTCKDVVRIIEAAFPDRIVFTEKAFKSLEDCVTNPELLWKLLYGMATDFYELLQSQPANACNAFATSSGFTYSRGAGSMTRKDHVLMRQYIDTYDGHDVSIETHFKKGNCDTDARSIRVYYAWEQEVCNKIIIGHCGKHLDNYSTRKIH